MVGLDKFKEAFAGFSDNYVIIGGTACDIVMTGTVVRPRATHDIDMIVVVENMTPEFGSKFWEFIKEADYRPERRKTEAGEPQKYELYRFLDGKEGYPEMIELLSRHPDVLGEPKKDASFTEQVVSDFHRILFNGELLTFADFNQEHRRCLDFIKNAVSESGAKHKIVVSHHVPSFKMLCPRFKDSKANGAFIVELADFIEDSGIDYWIYEHSHYNVDICIGNTFCTSNQPGYIFNNEHLTFRSDAFIEV